MWKRLSAVLALVALCGCFKTKDDLTVNADGSGKVRIETSSSLPSNFGEGIGGMMGGGGGVMYPPTSEEEARQFFPEKDFKVTVKQDRSTNGDAIVIIEAEFKDFNVLLASPYGRAHQLTAKLDQGILIVKGISGMEAEARLAEVKDETGMGMMGGYAELQRKTNEMRGEFTVTLPNAITFASGKHEGKTASWIAERATMKSSEEFARKLGEVCEVRCAADGIKFSSTMPVRLALLPFAELTPGAGTAKRVDIDTNKISSAVKFVPYGLSVSRAVDLSGAGGMGQSQAKLIGAVVVPREFAPQKWANPKLTEVLDAKGNDLKPNDSDGGFNFSMQTFDTDAGGDEEATNNAVRRVISLVFRPPDWKVNEIARIKGLLGLQYYGGSQTVVKLTNAIPANWVIDASKAMSGSFDSTEKNLTSPALSEQGLSLSVATCMAQSGVTMLSLQVEGKQATVVDAQVFDAQGRPWPTNLMPMGMGGESGLQLMVAGKPQPPFSLGLLVAGGGASVEVPILVEHVKITDK